MKAEAPSCEMGVHSVAYTSFAHRYPRQTSTNTCRQLNDQVLMHAFCANTAPAPLQLNVVRTDRLDRRKRWQVTFSKYSAFNGVSIQESFTSFCLQISERGLSSLCIFLHIRKIE